MCKVKVEVQDGFTPKEKVAYISTADGAKVEVFVSERSIDGDFLKALFVGEKDNQILLELPRETSAGAWRVWVPRDNVHR